MADKEQYVHNVSSFLSRTTVEVEKIMNKLSWTKEKLLREAGSSKLIQCPFNPSHMIPSAHIKRHVKVCQYASKGLNSQDVCCSPAFFYQSSKAVIPVSIGERQYRFFKNSKEGTVAEVPKEDQDTLDKPFTADPTSVSLNEEQPTLSSKTVEEDINKSIENIRSIMAWQVIPASHSQLELHLLSQQKIKTWIMENLPQVQYLSSVEGASDHLVNFVLSCLQETRVANPGGMEKMLTDLLGNETRSFVLKLWKFLAVSIASIKLDTNKDSTDPSECATLDPILVTEIPLPMDRVISELSPHQRLAMYEHVVRTSKATREERQREEMSDVVTDASASQAAEDLPKSHLEMLAERRDYKRRRQSYRAKNVHITKRSAVEVMRDLIETQMHVLEVQHKDEQDTSRTNSDEEDNSSEDKLNRDNKESEDYNREDGRGFEKGWEERRRDRRNDKEGSKRSRDYDTRELEIKRSRR